MQLTTDTPATTPNGTGRLRRRLRCVTVLATVVCGLAFAGTAFADYTTGVAYQPTGQYVAPVDYGPAYAALNHGPQITIGNPTVRGLNVTQYVDHQVVDYQAVLEKWNGSSWTQAAVTDTGWHTEPAPR